VFWRTLVISLRYLTLIISCCTDHSSWAALPLKMRTSHSFKTSCTTWPKQRHIPRDVNLQQHRWEKLIFCFFYCATNKMHTFWINVELNYVNSKSVHFVGLHYIRMSHLQCKCDLFKLSVTGHCHFALPSLITAADTCCGTHKLLWTCHTVQIFTACLLTTRCQ